jgi:integrase
LRALWHKSLSSLQREDIEAYQQFLVNPEPREFWCSGKSGSNAKRGEPGWKPFKQGLTESSLKTAVNCIYSLFDYLETAQYLRRNPMKLMRNRVRSSETLEVRALNRQAGILSPRQWGLLIETMRQMPEATYDERREKLRTQLIIGMLYFLGLRVSDLVNAKWQDFRVVNDKWWFEVVGKGNKKALLPVTTQLLDIIKTYRWFFKISELPVNGEKIRVIISWRGTGGIEARQINNILKKLAVSALQRIKPEHDDVEKLSAFSAHKIRHIMGSDLARAQLSTDARRKLMRHSKIETTLEYSHLSHNELHEAIEKLYL